MIKKENNYYQKNVMNDLVDEVVADRKYCRFLRAKK
jgi:hypothetical protein